MEILLGVMKSKLFNLGMNIFLSHVIRVSFFDITPDVFAAVKNVEKSGASVISQWHVGSLLGMIFFSSNGPTSFCAIRLALSLFSIRKMVNNLLRSDHFVMIRLNTFQWA